MKYIILILLSFNIAFADECPKEVMALKKGEPAPCSGVLFSPAKESAIFRDITLYKKEIDLLNQKVTLLEKDQDFYQRRLDNMMQLNDSISKELARREQNSFFNNSLYFGTGALLTGLIAYGVVNGLR